MEGHIEFHLPLLVAGPLVFLCLALGAYMSAAETAITGASRPRMHRLAQQGNLRATLVNRLLDRKDEAVSAVLLGNSVMNILSASLTTAVLTELFGAAGIVYATAIIGVMVVVFAEVMPKTWALLRADRVALILAPSIGVTLAILGPLARAVAWISRLFLWLMGMRTDTSLAAQEHDELLRGAIELHGVGHIDEDAPAEKAMLRSVLELGDRTVGDVMTKPWFIPQSTVLFDQLQAFRERHEHFAIVVDEYGVLQGIVTLEDIIEEIVGDIRDEHDSIKRGVIKREDGSLVSQGDVPIHDLNREFGWNLPEDVAITIAGLVLHEARRIPEVGQVYAFYGFRFEILKREGTRIAELRIIPPAAIQAATS